MSADGKAVCASLLIPGRRHDAYLFRNSGLSKFMKKTKRTPGRKQITHPALLADSGYVGLDEVYYELIVCKKNPPMGELSREDEETNSKLHSDRVLVENFFGRLKTVLGILASPYRRASNSLEDVVITCICLLNLKLKSQPLRNNLTDSDNNNDCEEFDLSRDDTDITMNENQE